MSRQECGTSASDPAWGRERRRRIALTGNQWESAYRFRGPLLQDLLDFGLDVHVIGPDKGDQYQQRLDALGLSTHGVPFTRAGLNPLSEWRTLQGMYRVYRDIRPDIVLSYFAKPIIYGSLAATVAGVPERYSLVAGLGYVFATEEAGRGFRRNLLEYAVVGLYRLALHRNRRVFFQNPEDMEQFIRKGLVRADATIRVNGTGVDLETWVQNPPRTEPVTFVLAARLVAEKGIREYAAAARVLRQRGLPVRCILLGGLDDNPSAITATEVASWVSEGLIEWPGAVEDVQPWLEASSVFVLPSFYREGVPRSIQEAMAVGRAIITTDTPGCRETVKDGVNGFLVQPRDVDGLAAAMEYFVQNRDSIAIMGNESRTMAEERFDVRRINKKILHAMKLVI